MVQDAEGRTDEALLEACREAGEEELRANLAVVVRRRQGALVAYLARMLGDDAAAEDLAQEAFLRVFRKAREYRSVARFSTWLYTIATHLAFNEVRDRRRRPSPSGALGEAPGPEAAPAGAPPRSPAGESREAAPGVALERAEAAGVVRRALLELDEPFRAVLVLCDMQGLGYQEAAEVLSVPVGTIRSRLSRARERFGRLMAPRLKAL